MANSHPTLAFLEAKDRMLRAALRCLSAQFGPETADTAADAEYADDELALAARDLTAATEALPSDHRPAGWPS
jgi:hypothetical protein